MTAINSFLRICLLLGIATCSFVASLSATWSAATTISQSNAAASQIVVDPDGNAIAIWQRTDGSTFRIEAATLPYGGNWSLPVAVSVIGQNAFTPQVAIDPQGNAVAVWIRFNGSNYIVQSSTLAFGGSWSTPVNVSLAGANAQEPQVAVDPQGNAVAVWHRVSGGFSIAQAAVLPFGGSWSTPVDLSAAGQNSQDAHVGVDASGNAVAVWTRYNGSNYIAQSSTLAFGGSWTSPVNLSAVGQDAILTQVVVDPSGDAIAVWARFNGTNSIIQSSRLPFGQVWTLPIDLSATGGDAQDPHLASDPNGNAIAIWSRNNGTNYIVQAATFHVIGGWGLPVDLSASGQNAFQGAVAMDAAGNAIACWSRFNGSNTIVQEAMLPFGGSWQPVMDISQLGQSSEAPHVAMDPTGYAVMDWRNDTLNVIQAATWTPAPTVISISPPCGSSEGSNMVTITGTNFENVKYVFFGKLKSCCFDVVDRSTIRARVPGICLKKHKKKVVDVIVVTEQGTSVIDIGDQYTYCKCKKND